MLWKEIRTWAKNLGYETTKDKEDNKYYWMKIDDQGNQIGGVEPSVSKLARAIYNHFSDYKWLDHQKAYEENLQLKKVEISDY